MRRLIIVATFLLLSAPALIAQVRFNGVPSSVTSFSGGQFHGIPSSVTSPTPVSFGHRRSFGGHSFRHGHRGFGRHHGFRHHGFRRHHGFSFSVGFNHFPHRRRFHRHRSFYPGYFPYYSYPVYAYAEPAYPVAVESDGRYYESSRYIELTRELDRLRLEVDRLREERAQPNQPAPQQAPPPAAYKPPADQLATVLVFRNGKREEVKNYAVVGQTLWVFTEQRARKVPLSDLDVSATRAINEERGSDFHIGNNH